MWSSPVGSGRGDDEIISPSSSSTDTSSIVTRTGNTSRCDSFRCFQGETPRDVGDGEASHAAFAFELGKLNELLEEVRVDAETKVIGVPESELKQYENREDFCGRWGRRSFQLSTRSPSTSLPPS